MRKKLLEKYYYYKAKRYLLKTYRFDRETTSIMEKWVTKRILEGQQGRKDELKELRGRLKEIELFIDYLKKI